MEHKYALGQVVRELWVPETRRWAVGIVIRRVITIDTDNPDAPAEHAYYVRFSDGRELRLAEYEIVEVPS